MPFPVDIPLSDNSTTHHFFRRSNRLLNLSIFLTGRPKLEEMVGEFDLAYLPDLNFLATHQPYTLTVHDLSFIRRPEFFSCKHRLRNRLTGLRRVLNQAALVIAASNHTKEDLVEVFNLDEALIQVVNPGVDTNFYHPLAIAETADIRKKYGLSEQFVLFLATLEPRKNVIGIIQAFDRADTGETELVLAGGRGWLYNQIFKTAKMSHKRDKIKFLGYIDENDKPALYSAATTFVYPSFYEGFGMPVLEALACGTPVIASSTTSLPEVVGEAGLLVNPDRTEEITWAINTILNDAELERHLRQAGPTRASQFTWDLSADRLEHAFAEIKK
ncbi:hypothetical protein A2480_02280 [Candidatus Uhrbacteria bacterium RIFOXYC2_FULL_47_19]|uniref:Glycosyl transferase family 1 domain-containing protein n=1 Tax=Candidatus Uhrbacteria bacterium RIFOXYC2_FULL_47_19 TaxID=1802424 RepID=A0A1F7WEZ4_9BACT|nr:MAG: hypothetical protein A2480_02280 [Candidatus Uhrbacteria bacterium RIFOXYC2_FULL_47_19]